MDFVALAMGGLQIGGGLIDLIGGSKAAKDAKRMANRQAGMEKMVTAEKIHNLEVQERTMKGQTIAGAAGSGVAANVGSPLDLLAEQAMTFARERMFVGKVGAEKAGLAQLRGKMAADSAKYSSFSSAIGKFAGATPDVVKFAKSFGG